jgi:hypothetical protein
MFLGHYDLRVYFSTAGGYVDIGRGSFGAARHLTFVQNTPAGCLGEIGQFCDFAEDAQIFAGGEHRNDLPIHANFSGVPAFRFIAAKDGIEDFYARPPRPFRIGHGSVLSAGTKLLGGASLGDGSLLAAGAVASGPLEGFAIHGGVPARKIRDRLDPARRQAVARVRWWDFDTLYMGNNLARLQALSVDESAEHIYRKPTPRFAMQMLEPQNSRAEVQLLGFVEPGSESVRAFRDAPAIRDYIAQLAGPGPHSWMPNIWDTAGWAPR